MYKAKKKFFEQRLKLCNEPLDKLARNHDPLLLDLIETNKLDITEAILNSPKYEWMDARALGNLAYVIIYVKDDNAKEVCLDMIDRYKKWLVAKIN